MISPHPTALALTIMIGTAIAGPLDPPPGPINSTGKTIAETEPRTAINAMNTPGDANSAFKITQSGSYYLPQNYLILGLFDDLHAIEIAADNVTIDLNGFSLTGLSGALSGIVTDGGNYQGITIRNGTVQSFDYGIDLDRNTGSDVTLEGLNVVNNDFDGIQITSGHIRNCTASENGRDGIVAHSETIIESCISIDNLQHGIDVGGFCIIRDCIVRNNGFAGIQSGQGGLIRDNLVARNGITSQTLYYAGIRLNGDSVLCHSNVVTHNYIGITTFYGAVISENIVMNNDINMQTNSGDPGVAGTSGTASGAEAWDNLVLPSLP